MAPISKMVSFFLSLVLTASLAKGQGNTTSIATTVAATITTATTPLSTSATPSTTTNSGASVVVDAAGGAQFTAINSAISYAQTFAIPTVYIKAGTYNENVKVPGTKAVSVIGETSQSNSYSANQVIISTGGTPMTIGTDSVQGITWRNINFVNTNTTSSSPAVSLRGTKNAFYNCQLISGGQQAVTSSTGITFMSGCYIEGSDKLFSGYLGMYIFQSTISPTATGSNIVFNKGYTSPGDSTFHYSQVVFDSCTIAPKTSLSNTNVYLAASNGAGSQAIWRSTSLASFVNAKVINPATNTYANMFWGEYATTGAGSFAANAATVSQRLDTLMTVSQLSTWSIDQVFGRSFYPYGTTDLTWIDSTVLLALQQSNAADNPTVSSSSSSSSSTTSTSSSSDIGSVSPSATTSLSSGVTSATTPTSQTSSISITVDQSSSSSTQTSYTAISSSSTTSTVPVATCSLPASIPATANVKTVGPAGSCANYTSVATAVKDLPIDSTVWYIYILAGTYTGQVSFARAGATIFRGESTSPLSQALNTVTISYSGSLLSSQGSAEPYSTFMTTQYSYKKYSFYNINFVNTYPITPNYVAIAMDIKAQQVGFYSCGFTSSQGTFLANYGSFYLSGCRIEGSKDFIWVYGAAYISNSQIVSNTPGYGIAAQNYQTTAGSSQVVFDQCSFVPKTASGMSQSTYLGRDYKPLSNVAIVNSFLDGHITPAGWVIGTPTTANVTFIEYNNTGAGYVPASRISQVQILTSNPYTPASVLGDVSWIDQSAVVPFTGFLPSVFDVTTTTTTTASSSTGTSSSTSTPTPTSSFVVSLTPSLGQYPNVSAAIAALPSDGKAYEILIMPGTYTEQITITRAGKVTLRGSSNYTNDYTKNTVTVQFNYGVSTSTSQNELTPVVNAKKTDGSGFILYNINFVNLFPQTKNYAALAADFYGAGMAAYGCSFIGYQDTLLANQGTQVFSHCYIEGSVDYIWGYSKAYFSKSIIATNTAGACIAAQSRKDASTAGGYVFDSCLVTYTSAYVAPYARTYLGRPYSNFSIAVYKNSYLDQHIAAAGWNVWATADPRTSNVLLGEYNNVGPGAWSSSRASFATNLTATQAAAYDLATFMGDTSWIDMTTYNADAIFSFSANGTSGTPTASATVSTATVTATADATTLHPTSGTVPPQGAVLVSVNGAIANSFSSLTAALASLPADTTNQTVFMYPGSYTEQISVNRAGSVKIIGYQSGNPGQAYSGNQVTVTYAKGLSVVAPIAAGRTDADTATFATASNKISVYNVNFINTENLDGSTTSYVTLASSIYGDQIGFYGCSFVGWQDTLLTGNPAGYAYYESSYIEGAIDFIWGYSMSYFKGCTIAAKRAKSCMTAQSRASASAIGGYVFDQCLFTTAASSTVDLTQMVYLGRPYSQYATVAIKYSYLDSSIQPAGWKAWSTSDARLDHATFTEFQNTGPGNWESNAAARVAFGNASLLTSDQYPLSSVMASTSWIDMTYWNSIVTPVPATAAVTTVLAANSTYPGNATCIVSKTAITNQTTYTTIQACINKLSSGSSVASIFIYPGTYNEQIVFNRTGATSFIGYAPTPGSYSKNQVIIQNSVGVNTQSDQSNSDSATFYNRGKNVKFYNINFVNSFGTTDDYASLAFASGNNGYTSFYGCQLIGNQDTFDVNSGCSVFVYNSYVEGSVDFIWGAGSAYFLGSTISPNTLGVSITADKRTTNTTAAGFVFDQCRVTPSAAGANVAGIAGSISLGRPWNANARVAYIQTYMDSCVSAAGWAQWSSSSPQTDGVIFGEYYNTGPGAVSTSRASFSHQLTEDEASTFELATFFTATSWIDFTTVSLTPFIASVRPSQVSTSIVYQYVSTTMTITADLVTKASKIYSTLTFSATYTVTKLESKATKVTSSIVVTPTPVYKYTTVNNQVTSTVSVAGGSDVTTTSTSTQTATLTLTVAGPTAVQLVTTTVTSVQSSIITLAPKSVTVNNLETQTVTKTSTPKGKTVKVKVTTTVGVLKTAATPSVITTTTTTSEVIKTIFTTPPAQITTTETETTTTTPKAVTKTAADAETSVITMISTISKSTTIVTTLSCTPTAKAKRDFVKRAVVERAATSSTGSVSIVTTTVISTYTSTITTLVGGKGQAYTATTYYPSSLTVSYTLPASTETLTLYSTQLTFKTATLDASTITSTSTLAGTIVVTSTLKPVTYTSLATTTNFKKTSTVTLLGHTDTSLTTSTKLTTIKTTLPVQTITYSLFGTTSITATVTLAPVTTTTSQIATKLSTSTITPDSVTVTNTKIISVTSSTTITVDVDQTTVTVSKTSTTKAPTPTVLITRVTTTTTVKSTEMATIISTKYVKNAPTCSA